MRLSTFLLLSIQFEGSLAGPQHLPTLQGLLRRLETGLSEECKNETYSLSGFAHEHLILVATPSEQRSTCPTLAFHDTDEGPTQVAIDHDDMEQATSTFNSIAFGSFSYGRIEQAFLDAQKRKDSTRPYDIVTNNCATFFLDMLLPLGIVVDQRMVDFAINELAQSPRVLETLFNSPSLQLLLENGQSPEDAAFTVGNREIITKLVVYYVQQHSAADIQLEKNDVPNRWLRGRRNI